MDEFTPKYVRRGETRSPDPVVAVAEFAGMVEQPEIAFVIFFCSADYDLPVLAGEFRRGFNCPVIGCTSAGEIGSTYQEGGIVGASFSSAAFRLHTLPIELREPFSEASAAAAAQAIQSGLEFSDGLNSSQMFGLLLIDGLCLREEQTIASLYRGFEGVPIFGGSAGDSLKFERTSVYFDGEFRESAAVFALIETRLRFQVFRLQHFEPSEMELVITESEPTRRVVTEIDGEPAAAAYAEIIGMKKDNLSSQVFAAYPVMLQIGDEWYVRSIAKTNDDGSLTFFCAIDNGLPLNIARGVGFVESLSDKIDEIRKAFPRIEMTLGCDCILRRLEMRDSGQQPAVESLLQNINFMGFSTFGEQFNSIHVNQTLTGVVLAGD